MNYPDYYVKMLKGKIMIYEAYHEMIQKLLEEEKWQVEDISQYWHSRVEELIAKYAMSGWKMNIELNNPELFVIISTLKEFKPNGVGETLVLNDLIKKLEKIKQWNKLNF